MLFFAQKCGYSYSVHNDDARVLATLQLYGGARFLL